MEENLTTGEVAKKWGVIYALVTTIVNITPMLMELQLNWLWAVNIIVAVVIYLLAQKEFKQGNGGFMTFGEGFRISLTAAAIAGVTRSVIGYVYIKFIDPEYTERMKEVMREAWREQGMTAEQIEQAEGFSGAFSNPEIGLVVGIIIVILGALIFGSIVSAIVKNEAEEF